MQPPLSIERVNQTNTPCNNPKTQKLNYFVLTKDSETEFLLNNKVFGEKIF